VPGIDGASWILPEPYSAIWRDGRSYPGELIRIDTKKLGRIKVIGHRITGNRRQRGRRAGWEFVHVAIDDASRLAYAEVLANERSPTAAAFLKRLVAWYSSHGVKVSGVMTDNGSCYVSHRFASGEARCLRSGDFQGERQSELE
jgi:hypothetical protein